MCLPLTQVYASSLDFQEIFALHLKECGSIYDKSVYLPYYEYFILCSYLIENIPYCGYTYTIPVFQIRSPFYQIRGSGLKESDPDPDPT